MYPKNYIPSKYSICHRTSLLSKHFAIIDVCIAMTNPVKFDIPLKNSIEHSLHNNTSQTNITKSTCLFKNKLKKIKDKKYLETGLSNKSFKAS